MANGLQMKIQTVAQMPAIMTNCDHRSYSTFYFASSSSAHVMENQLFLVVSEANIELILNFK